MSFSLVYTEAYNRRASKWLKKHPDLRQQYLKTVHNSIDKYSIYHGTSPRTPGEQLS